MMFVCKEVLELIGWKCDVLEFLLFVVLLYIFVFCVGFF